MEAIITRCGYRCDLCLAYKPNIEAHPENRQILSDGWYKYFGFRIQAEDIYCDGCLSEGGKLIDKSCPVWPCAIERRIDHCDQCEEFVCEKLQGRLVDFDEIQVRFGEAIPQEDRQRFITPYENRIRFKNRFS
jgi:hypothetical protein